MLKQLYGQLAQNGISRNDLFKLSLKAVEDHQVDDQEKSLLDKAVVAYNKSHKDKVTLSIASDTRNGQAVAAIDLSLSNGVVRVVDPALKPLKELTPLDLEELGARPDKSAFFNALLPAALESERLHGVPASVTLAQAALESGWGSAGSHFNLFGIKGKGTDGTSAPLVTDEYIDGKKVTIKDKFAKYKDYHDGVLAHGQFFVDNLAERGSKLLVDGKVSATFTDNPKKFVDGMLKGYATAPDYQKLVLSIMKGYKLEALVAQAKAK